MTSMTAKDLHQKWTKLQCPAIFEELRNMPPTKINSHQLVITSAHFPLFTDYKNQEHDGIYLYDTHTNQWTHIAQYQSNAEGKFMENVFEITPTYNPFHNQLYFQTTPLNSRHGHNQWVAFDMKTNKFIMDKPIQFDRNRIHRNVVNVGKHMHFIGGAYGKRHTILNTINNSVETIDHTEFRGIPRIKRTQSIYIKSKQMLLLIGGHTCLMVNDAREKDAFGVWRFCLKKRKWEQLKEILLHLADVSCATSMNENFVIIAGGIKFRYDQHHEYNDKIYVLDIRDDDNYRLREGTIKMPYCSSIILMGGAIEDELLVIGWIKRLFKTKEFKHLSLPPMYLMKAMCLWYDQEEIHRFKHSDKSHHVMKLDHILSSLKS